jgi:hypothetical protein
LLIKSPRFFLTHGFGNVVLDEQRHIIRKTHFPMSLLKPRVELIKNIAQLEKS